MSLDALGTIDGNRGIPRISHRNGGRGSKSSDYRIKIRDASVHAQRWR